MKGKTEQIYHLLLGILLLCTLPIMALLAYWACRYSYYGTVNYSIRNILVKDTAWKHIVMFLLAVAVVWGLDRLLVRTSRAVQEKICLGVLTLTCVAAFVLGIVYVWKNPYFPEGDQLGVAAFAAYAREGNYIMLEPGGYVGMYQQQKGLGALYEILFTFFGNFNYMSAKNVHVIWWVFAIAAGYGFLKLNTERSVFRILYCAMLLGCMPFLLYLPYIYGDILSISFCMILFWAVSAYEHYEQKRYLVVAAFAAAMALLARKNTWIVLIGVAIYALLISLKKKKWKCLLVGAAILLTAALSVKAVDVMYEYRSGYPSGIGIPSILWIAMGMQETDGMAGVYNRYQQSVFEENDFQQEPSAQIGREYIRERLQEFKENPAMTVEFFKKKLEDQWLEPLFSSLKATHSFPEGEELPPVINSLYYGNLHEVVWKYANYYQSIIYLAGLLTVIASFGAWYRKKDLPAALWLPLIAVVGGFLFSILWEAQCRYVFPYYVFLILYAPMGLYAAGRMIGGLWNLRRGNKTKEQTDAEKDRLREIA